MDLTRRHMASQHAKDLNYTRWLDQIRDCDCCDSGLTKDSNTSELL